MLDDKECRVELLTDAQQQWTERLCLALRDTGGRFVEEQHGRLQRDSCRDLDEPPGAGRQLGDECVGVPTETHELDELVRARALRALC